jgi:hypothetical protein
MVEQDHVYSSTTLRHTGRGTTPRRLFQQRSGSVQGWTFAINYLGIGIKDLARERDPRTTEFYAGFRLALDAVKAGSRWKRAA